MSQTKNAFIIERADRSGTLSNGPQVMRNDDVIRLEVGGQHLLEGGVLLVHPRLEVVNLLREGGNLLGGDAILILQTKRTSLAE